MALLGGSKKNSNSTSLEVAQTNIIGKGTTVKGNLETNGNIRIEGNVEGNIHCKAKVVFGESAYMNGNIYAQNVEIAGQIDGAVHVTDVLTLKPTALINGDIFTGSLVVEQGAKFNGKCEMKKTPETPKTTPENPKTPPNEPKTK